MELCIIGSGYVGLVSGACFAEVGHHVVCVDNDQRKVDALQAGKIPIYEPGLEDLVHRNVAAKRLRFTNSIEDGVDHSQIVFIAVPTPQQPDGSVDLSFIEKVAREIAGKSPDAIRAAKRMLNNLSVDPGPALLAESVEQQKLLGSPNQTEAVRANMEKRAPRFAEAG